MKMNWIVGSRYTGSDGREYKIVTVGDRGFTATDLEGAYFYFKLVGDEVGSDMKLVSLIREQNQ